MKSIYLFSDGIFVSETLEDMVTRQYNASIEEILPRYDINLKAMQRKKDDKSYISLGRIRCVLRDGEMEDMKKFLPATTFD